MRLPTSDICDSFPTKLMQNKKCSKKLIATMIVVQAILITAILSNLAKNPSALPNWPIYFIAIAAVAFAVGFFAFSFKSSCKYGFYKNEE